MPAVKTAPKMITLNSLLSKVSKSFGNSSFLKAAAKDGILANPEFMLRVTDEEKSKIEKVYGKNDLYRNCEKADLSFLPKLCGAVLEKPKSFKEKTKFEIREEEYVVDGALLQFMMKRYPEANLYQSNDGKFLMISDKNLKAAIKMEAVTAN
jgi:hypothetical protein